MSKVVIDLEPEELGPLVRKIAAEVLSEVQDAQQRLGGRLAFSEEEAARLLGLKTHVLRDERLRGRINASEVVGRRIRYFRDDLINYMLSRRFEPRPDRGR